MSEGDILLTDPDDPINDDAAFRTWVAKLTVDEPVTLHRMRVDESGEQWTTDEITLTPQTHLDVQTHAMPYRYVELHDEWVELPAIDLSRGSSRRKPYRANPDLSDDENEELRTQWDQGLPHVERGQYGSIIGCTVREVIDGDEVVIDVDPVRDLYFAYQTAQKHVQTVKLVGVDTKGLSEGDRFEPDALVIVGSCRYVFKDEDDGGFFGGSGTNIHMAIPLETVRAGLSDDDLTALKAHLGDR